MHGKSGEQGMPMQEMGNMTGARGPQKVGGETAGSVQAASAPKKAQETSVANALTSSNGKENQPSLPTYNAGGKINQLQDYRFQAYSGLNQLV